MLAIIQGVIWVELEGGVVRWAAGGGEALSVVLSLSAGSLGRYWALAGEGAVSFGSSGRGAWLMLSSAASLLNGGAFVFKVCIRAREGLKFLLTLFSIAVWALAFCCRCMGLFMARGLILDLVGMYP